MTQAQSFLGNRYKLASINLVSPHFTLIWSLSSIKPATLQNEAATMLTKPLDGFFLVSTIMMHQLSGIVHVGENVTFLLNDDIMYLVNRSS